MASLRRFKVIDNYREPLGFRYTRKPVRRPGEPEFEPRYQRLTPEVICDLLERSDKMWNGAALPNVIPARQLLERMSSVEWTCTATAHEGGREQPRGGRANDPYLHFNIWFEKDGQQPQHYHVRCHEIAQGGLYVFQVTF